MFLNRPKVTNEDLKDPATTNIRSTPAISVDPDGASALHLQLTHSDLVCCTVDSLVGESMPPLRACFR